MNKKLYLLRHGKSDWSQAVSDFRRPLSGRGISESIRLGSWMRENGYIPELVVSSPAQRALETARLVMQETLLDEARLMLDDGFYLADAETLLETVQETPEETDSVMLVGHNPGMESLLVSLAGKAMPSAGLVRVLPTATLACLSVAVPWHDVLPGSCTLEFIIRGKGL